MPLPLAARESDTRYVHGKPSALMGIAVEMMATLVLLLGVLTANAQLSKGGILVTDATLQAVVKVDPADRNRNIVSYSTTGTGPDFFGALSETVAALDAVLQTLI